MSIDGDKDLVIVKGTMVPPKKDDSVVMEHVARRTVSSSRANSREKLCKAVIPEEYLDEKTIFYLNPSGCFIIGGPHGSATTIVGMQQLHLAGNRENTNSTAVGGGSGVGSNMLRFYSTVKPPLGIPSDSYMGLGIWISGRQQLPALCTSIGLYAA